MSEVSYMQLPRMFSIPARMPPEPINTSEIPPDTDDPRARRRRELLIAMHKHLMPGDELPPVEEEDDES